MSLGYYDSSYPPSLWDGSAIPDDGRDSASPGDSFTDPNITASDALNAAKLTARGFVASPQSDWTVGQSMTVNTFAFNWNGTAWVAGVSAAQARTASEAPSSPQDSPEAPEAIGTAQEAPEAPQADSESDADKGE